MSRALRIGCGMGTHVRLRGDGERQILDALRLLQDAAQLLLECDIGKTRAELLERDLKILVIEELGIVESRTHHALVTVDDGFGACGATVAHHDKLARQGTRCVVDGEIALVGEHGLADDLVRDLEELIVKGASEHTRPLAQVNHLIEHLLRRIHMSPATLGLDALDAFGNHGAAALLGEHARSLEHLLVDGWLSNFVLPRRQHAMPARGIARGDIGVTHRDDLGAQQRTDPTNGTHERLMRGTPALAAIVGPLQVSDDLLTER